MTDVAQHAAELCAQGFTVLRAAYSADWVRTLRGALEHEYDRAGRPPLVGEGHLVETGSDIAPTAAGFAVRQLLWVRPDLAPTLLTPDLVEVLRAALGEGVVLELAGGLLSDPSRPFFKWHNHVGGIDDHRWEGRSDYPHGDRPERVLVLVYLQPLIPALGSLLVLPRAPGDPVRAPYPLDALRWEGQLAIEAPAGTAVLLEQRTWHAALRQSEPGLRMFVGFYFAAADAPPGPGTDEALRALATDAPLLRSVLPRSA